MPVEKILSKIRAQIGEVTPLLESFSDRTVQPGVEDCEKLQRELNLLLEHISVYKYNKQNYAVSPSFNLHAHISENTAVASASETLVRAMEPPKTDTPPSPEPVVQPVQKQGDHKPVERTTEPKEPAKQLRPLHIGLNDKFRFINELFAKNNAEYHIAVEQLSNLQTWPETDLYLNSLKNLYGWRENHDAVKHFFSIIKKRFQ
jgi:hypothetical protein